jgi:hypothetical protein
VGGLLFVCGWVTLRFVNQSRSGTGLQIGVIMSERVRNSWGVVPPKSVAWSKANGVCDGYEFVCRACCDVAIEQVSIYETEGDRKEFWLSAMSDEGYRAVSVAQGVECASCEKVVK